MKLTAAVKPRGLLVSCGDPSLVCYRITLNAGDFIEALKMQV